MRARGVRHAGGFSLLELVASLVVISVISAVLAPVLNNAADAIVTARDVRRASDDAGFALAAVTRLLREIPADGTGGLDITAADAGSILLGDGRGVRLSGTTLEMVTPDGAAPLAREVAWFEVAFIAADGRSPASPELAQRLHVRMSVRGMSLSGVVFPRVNSGQSGPGVLATEGP